MLTETDIDQGDLDRLRDPDAPQNRGQVAATGKTISGIVLFVNQYSSPPTH